MNEHDINTILDGLREMEFTTISAFNDGHAGAFWSGPPADGAATSPWEVHTDTDELLMCIDGAVEIQILDPKVGDEPMVDDLVRVSLTAGQFAVVPQGHWHRHHATAAFREFYVTPGSSDTSFDADPRVGVQGSV